LPAAKNHDALNADTKISREAPMTKGCRLAIIALACVLPLSARAEQIVVSNYGVTTNGMPFAVAMAKGFFKQQGADVTGILSSDGGGTTVRTLLGGNLAYGEINPTATVIAIQQGADLKIVSDNVQTVAEFTWAVKPDSPIKTAADLKGRKIGYTNPRSTSQALAILVLEKAGLKPTDAELVKTGGFGEGIVALDLGAVDITPIPEPLWSQHQGKYRAVVKASDVLPPLDNVVGVTTGKAAAARGDFIRAVIRARRQAVDYMYANPDESGDIVAKAYNLSPEVARSAVKNLLASHDKSGVRYWGPGNFNIQAMNEMMRAQKLVGALKDDPDWSKIIDESFLPDDLKRKTN
jgi:NitT/TauT family transport system substrate-binding protein